MRLLLILLSALFGYHLADGQDDNGLRLLNNKERIDYVRSGQLPGARTVIKDSAGIVLKNLNLKFPVIDNELYSALDYYVDGSGKIKEVVIRKPLKADQDLIKKLYDLEEERMRGTMETAHPDCKQERDILADVLKKETENRKNEQVLDAELDNQLEATVIALLQSCPEPTLSNVGTDGIRAVFLILQHARRKFQDKYFPLLDSWVRNGNIRKGSTAAIEDRLLMTSGSAQRYGTQIVFFARTGYHLFPIQDPDKVDERRLALGLSPLDQYIKEREEFYGAPINR